MRAKLFAIGFAAALVAATSCSGKSSPISPGGYDPSKPVDQNNIPPGPGTSRLATTTFKVTEGNKEIQEIDDPQAKAEGINHVYVLQGYFPGETAMYGYYLDRALTVCVTHPKISGRKLLIRYEIRWATESLEIQEGQAESPVCGAINFNFRFRPGDERIVNQLDGSISVAEDGQDLALEPQTKEIKLRFKICRRTGADGKSFLC